MSDKRSDSLDRPVGELWVELSRDEKKKICDALIDRNKPDVMQEFASLVRFTRGYLRQQPNGSLPPSNEKRKNEEVLVDTFDNPSKKVSRMGVKFEERQVGPTYTTVPSRVSQSEYDDEY